MTEIPTDGYKKVLGATKDKYLKIMEIFFRTLSLQVAEGKTVSVLCVTVWEAKWCKEKFDKDASRVRAVGTVTAKNGSQGEWNVKFPFPEKEANHTVYDYLLRVENPADVKVGTFIYDDPTTRRIYGVQGENRETRTPLRKSVDFKTNDARIRQILTAASLGNGAKIIQVTDALKAMYPATSLDVLIRDHFAASSGYKSLGNTVGDKAKSMASALVEGYVAWQGIVEVETGASYKPATSNADAFNAALLQREANLAKEMDMLREENKELRAAKRHKGEQGKATATLKNRLEEEGEAQQETGTAGLRNALVQLADDEADRALLLDKYKIRGIAEVHLIKTSVLRRIMKRYGVSLMELRPAKNGAEYGHDTGKLVMTPELFQRLLRALLRITSAFFPQHRDDIMDHFHEVLDYLRTHSLQSVIDWTYAVRCQVPLGEWAQGDKSLRLGTQILRATSNQSNQHHDRKSQGGPKPKATSDVVCKQWGTGNCTWGKKCKFLHACPVCNNETHIKALCPKKASWPF
eukprot:g37535.t1